MRYAWVVDKPGINEWISKPMRLFSTKTKLKFGDAVVFSGGYLQKAKRNDTIYGWVAKAMKGITIKENVMLFNELLKLHWVGALRR